MEKITRYRAFGLVLASHLPFPLDGLVAASPDEPADLALRVGRVEPSAVAGELPWRFHGDVALYDRPELARIRVRSGEIVVDPAPGVDERALRVSVLGPALAIALHQRGALVLHGSSVLVGGGAVAIVGASGHGKSTLATALADRGHPLLADDITAIDLGPPPRVRAGIPRVKLWPDAVLALGRDPAALPLVREELTKRDLAVPVADHAAPLARVLVLEPGAEVGLRRLRPVEATYSLLRTSYVAPALHGDDAKAQFTACAGLARIVPVFLLTRSASLADLPALIALVES